jgi:hypothetical protein
LENDLKGGLPMKIEQRKWTKEKGWTPELHSSSVLDFKQSIADSAQLVLVFGSPSTLRENRLLQTVAEQYPRAHILGCSTAGEICGTAVSDESLVVTAVSFDHTQIKCAGVALSRFENSFQAGESLARALPKSIPAAAADGEEEEQLVHVLVLSDGLHVNGSELVLGLTKHLPEDVTVTGGLAGDGERFRETLVLWNGTPEEGNIAALGLYGKRLRVGSGSLGGWDPFGPERLVTRSKGNVLYDLDGRSALGLYKTYLGEHAKGLPATGLLFPLSVRTKTGEKGLVRTILSIDEKEQSMTFAGDVPEGAYARLMKANFDRLIDGAIGAAKTSRESIGSTSPELAILISCVGRKLVLRQRVEEEVEGVREILGGRTALTGFYSYGEIAPFAPAAKSELHNQTMTITTLSER